MFKGKLENIISGYRINKDDADWLRALLDDHKQLFSLREKIKALESKNKD